MVPILTFHLQAPVRGPMPRFQAQNGAALYFPELFSPRQLINLLSSFNNMADVNALPTEVLHDIISYLSLNYIDLRNCTLVCRALWEVATAALYTHIDLTFEERGDEEADEKTQRRQLRLMRSLAE